MSLDTLLELLGITKHDASTRKVMKKWVKRNFEHEVMFLSGEEKKGQLIISKTCLDDICRGEKVKKSFPKRPLLSCARLTSFTLNFSLI